MLNFKLQTLDPKVQREDAPTPAHLVAILSTAGTFWDIHEILPRELGWDDAVAELKRLAALPFEKASREHLLACVNAMMNLLGVDVYGQIDDMDLVSDERISDDFDSLSALIVETEFVQIDAGT